jgi:hypothetical protein
VFFSSHLPAPNYSWSVALVQSSYSTDFSRAPKNPFTVVLDDSWLETITGRPGAAIGPKSQNPPGPRVSPHIRPFKEIETDADRIPASSFPGLWSDDCGVASLPFLIQQEFFQLLCRVWLGRRGWSDL